LAQLPHGAARRVRPRTRPAAPPTDLDRRILDVLAAHGPATTAQISAVVGDREYSHDTIARRRVELARYGWIRAVGEVTTARSGRCAVIWALVPEKMSH